MMELFCILFFHTITSSNPSMYFVLIADLSLDLPHFNYLIAAHGWWLPYLTAQLWNVRW